MKSFIAIMLIAAMTSVTFGSECANGKCGLRTRSYSREHVVLSNGTSQRTYTLNKNTNRRSTYKTRTTVR